MNKTNISVQVLSFRDLCSKFPAFDVPRYQRSYSWDKEQWSQLWLDLTESAEEGEHFIGNIVLCRPATPQRQGAVEVVDGQQRVTTLSVVVAALRNHLWDQERYTDALQLHDNFLVYARFGGSPDPRLHLSQRDQPWFAEYVHCNLRTDGHDTEFPRPPRSVSYGIPTSQRKLWKAYNYFAARVRDEMADRAKLDALLNYISEGVLFTATHLDDGADAYDLFECLNDRGLPLSVSDLFKNFLLSHATNKSAETRRHLEESWNGMEEILTDCDLGDYFRHHWLSTRSRVLKKHLYRTMRKAVLEGDLDLEEYIPELKSGAVNYKDLIGKGSASTEQVEEILSELRGLGYKVVNSLLLAGWSALSREEDRLKLVRTVDTFLVRYATFAGQVTNRLESKLSQLAVQLRSGESLQTLRQELQELSPSEDQVWTGLRDSGYSSKVATILLHRIERAHGATQEELAGTIAVQLVPSKRNQVFRMEQVADEDGLASRSDLLSSFVLLPKDQKSAFEASHSGSKRLDQARAVQLPLQSRMGAGSLDPKVLDERMNLLLESAKKIWTWNSSLAMA